MLDLKKKKKKAISTACFPEFRVRRKTLFRRTFTSLSGTAEYYVNTAA